jgi:hypothetical protein
MEKEKKTSGKQAVKGKFPPGNNIGPRFPKGVSGNPAGRPKLTRLTEALREQLSQEMPGAPEYSIAEAIARTLVKEALSGNVQAIREIGDRTEGKPKQAIDVDLQVKDWRSLAQSYGVTEQDVIAEAKLLIAESADDSSGE